MMINPVYYFLFCQILTDFQKVDIFRWKWTKTTLNEMIMKWIFLLKSQDETRRSIMSFFFTVRMCVTLDTFTYSLSDASGSHADFQFNTISSGSLLTGGGPR